MELEMEFDMEMAMEMALEMGLQDAGKLRIWLAVKLTISAHLKKRKNVIIKQEQGGIITLSKKNMKREGKSIRF